MHMIQVPVDINWQNLVGDRPYPLGLLETAHSCQSGGCESGGSGSWGGPALPDMQDIS